jgi:molecular chaperone HscB
MDAPESCWHCGQPAADSLFCAYCNRLQPPAPDYFRFFGLEPRLALDPEDLQRRYYELSRKLHPDRFLAATAAERQYSLEGTAILNDAYRVLRDPVARAEYLLRREGLEEVSPGRRTPPELLREIFELNEALEAFREDPRAGRAQLDRARERLRALRQQADAELARLFRLWDERRERGRLEEVRGVLERRRYVSKLETQLEEALSDVGAHPD